MNERNQIRDKAMEEYLSYVPDMLATACPLCKKTFAKNRDLPVYDIAEIVYMAIKENNKSFSSKAEFQQEKNAIFWT
ncbi:MAG: hypothetical protein PHC28_17495, partial [Flavobacterium sp.]|nr:hypothetical protein [Flavobacterium sp.]